MVTQEWSPGPVSACLRAGWKERVGQQSTEGGLGKGCLGHKKDGQGTSCPKGSSLCQGHTLWPEDANMDTSLCEDVRCVGALHGLTVSGGKKFLKLTYKIKTPHAPESPKLQVGPT